jgi:hypothetical protein
LESTRSERRSPSLYRVEHHVELTEDLVILILVCEKVHTVGEIRAPQHKKKHGVRGGGAVEEEAAWCKRKRGARGERREERGERREERGERREERRGEERGERRKEKGERRGEERRGGGGERRGGIPEVSAS